MTTIITTANTSSFQQKNEEAVKQFIMNTLNRTKLPDGSLQEILKDGILLCELIIRFSPNSSIVKNEGKTKFAYQDNIGQFLRVAEDLHIPQSDLFQTVDLLEGKRMQSVISCLLAIKRIMCEKKAIPKEQNLLSASKKNSSGTTRNLLLFNDIAIPTYKRRSTPPPTKKFNTSYHVLPKNNSTVYPLQPKSKVTTAPTTATAEIVSCWPKKSTATSFHRRLVEPEKSNSKAKPERAKEIQHQNGGYVKSQVHMITTSNPVVAALEPPMHIRRLSSESMKENNQTVKSNNLQLPPIPKPSKSTPTSTSTKLPTSSTAAKKTSTPPPSKYTQSSMEYTSTECTSSNRKASFKKMGSIAITVQTDDGTEAVYALGRSIGKGQFGEVFGGLNMDTGEYVAIKRIKRNQMDCDDMNEVGVLKHLDNEHIVRYVGFCKDEQYLNIILEYVEMGSLHNNIKSFGKFPEKLAASYTYKILSGLHYLHSKDVIHCDLKAANILTTKTGSLKLTDFGVSLSLKMKDDETTGEPAGTPNWMAPEVIKFAGASAKSDIWSLGCTIVEMLTGKPPYANMPSFTALYRIVEDEEAPIPKNVNISEELRDFLLQCFQKDPQDRPTAYELMKSKWMEPYFSPNGCYETNRSNLLAPPPPAHRTVKKSKSETCLEYSDSETIADSSEFMMHEFVDYQTYQNGEPCYGCGIQMKRLWVKSCEDCQLKFHHHCVNRTPSCTKDYSIPQAIAKSSSTKSNSTGENVTGKNYNPRYTPLGPLKGANVSEIKKVYLPVMKQKQQAHYKSEGYSQAKNSNSNTKRNFLSSIMT